MFIPPYGVVCTLQCNIRLRPNLPIRKVDVKLTRIRIGHTRFTHRHLLFGERAPLCPTCHEHFTINHILIECPSFKCHPIGLRNGPVIHPERTNSKPTSRKREKSTKSKSSKTAVAPQEAKITTPKGVDDAPKEQPMSAPLSFASAAQKGASMIQDPPVRISAPSTKTVPPGRTNLSKAKRSVVFLIYHKVESDISTSSQLLKCLERNISLGKIGVKMVATRPIRDGGLVLVTETKPMSEVLQTAIQNCPAVVDKVSVRAPKGRVSHILVFDVPVGKYASRDKEAKWICRLRKSNNLAEGEISVRFRRKGKNGTEQWILALDPDVFKGIPTQGHLNHGYISFRYREVLEPTRCFKCQKFGHVRSQCPDLKRPDYCTKCTGKHLPKD
ncbi:hypothetical protein AVEN_213954-1 [Araneus ventricosus]|uniref:CCHC-type domain-containing protein n=1 Tax=Araneus ventricosus TaxID=182803 RepID=A0A4Y2WTZ8_ARAVE|nr:hypothetical protein AVEN_213954-1 [Araneus ventricosus]